MKSLAATLALLLLDSSWRSENADPAKFELLRTFGPAQCSSVSPAGNYIAFYAGNNVSIIDVRRGQEARVLAGHNANIHDSGWSRDGRIYATSGYDKSVCVWEAATGRRLQTLPLSTGYA